MIPHTELSAGLGRQRASGTPITGIALAHSDGERGVLKKQHPWEIFASTSCRPVNVETNSADLNFDRRPLAMILVVEDDAERLKTLRFVLSMFGFESFAARSAREVLKCVEERQPDLILTDSPTPSMSGFELCRVLRASQRARRIPIVLKTGVQMPDDTPRLYDQIVRYVRRDVTRLSPRSDNAWT